ncbi:hypothetical protein [Flavobacterium algicola]|uniref:hypothetical protein n=1 Tax=Flavobacterium algicola TaxID=556529 RepID=UPI001EFDCE7D|nr:hypothetical protein [Flavobacterium algicola]MCG9792560.1 hypothetical protein [Flavobacterium algicola]
MEHSTLKKKKKDNKPLYILAGALLFFCLFIYVISIPSNLSKALKELKVSYSKKDIEMVWYKYKADLFDNDEFLFEVRTKLSDLKLTEVEVDECRSWLPPPPTSLNLIVIPDLSRRIIDSTNNPNQIKSDSIVLQTIWQSFVNYSKLKQNTKDKLIIDITDIDQAKGQFGKVANELQFDLSSHTGKSNILYFTKDKDEQFRASIKQLYNLAKEKPLGADYRFYFRRYLKNHLKKSTLFDNFTNKIIIITDGYLEAENKIADTKIKGFEKYLYPAVSNNNILEVINKRGLSIPKVDIDLSKTEILICEVNERKIGKGYDFDILKTYWEDWLSEVNKKNIRFVQHEQASSRTINYISTFVAN